MLLLENHLHDILHRTENGLVRAKADAGLLAIHILKGDIAMQPLDISIPPVINTAPLPAAARNEGVQHRRLKLLGAAIALAWDERAQVRFEQSLAPTAPKISVDVLARSRRATFGFEAGVRDGRYIPGMLDALSALVVLPFHGWAAGAFRAWIFARSHQPLPEAPNEDRLARGLGRALTLTRMR